MGSLLSYSAYGWRARIGLILGAANIVTEPEFSMLLPDGVSAHAARLIEPPSVASGSLEEPIGEIEAAARALALAEVDLVVYLPNQGSLISGSPESARRVSELTGAPTITAGEALIRALKALHARNIALATPHGDFVSRQEKGFLEKNHFQVLSVKSLELGTEEVDQQSLGKVPPEGVYRLAKEADKGNPDAVVITGATIATADIIESLEDDLDKPVLTTNQSCLWLALRRLSIAHSMEGYGRLLSEF